MEQNLFANQLLVVLEQAWKYISVLENKIYRGKDCDVSTHSY